MGHESGRSTAMTVFTPIRPGLSFLCRVNFWAGREIPLMTAILRRLSFIHFARWAIVDHIADNGPPQREERLRYKYLFFESNFNGGWDDYIDAFSYSLPWRMRATWGTSFGFPGPLPVGPFKDYIRRNDFRADHFYAAYPDQSTTMVLAALRLGERLDAFQAETADLGPDEFAAAYRRFVRASQADL